MACNYLHGTMAYVQVVPVQHVGQKLQQLKTILLLLAQNCCACVHHPSVEPAKHTHEMDMCMPQLKLTSL